MSKGALRRIALDAASRAVADASVARDRECVKLGPVCRAREDALSRRQTELAQAMAAAVDRADPQAAALGLAPANLRKVQAGMLVAMCLLAGALLSHGWGLVARR